MSEGLRLVIRTPRTVVLDARVRAVRVPAASGQVGLRPRGEPFVLVVEAGLIVLRMEERVRFASTAGGLLDVGRADAELLSPFAVVGDTEPDVLGALDRALEQPDSDVALRRRLGELEQRVVRELRRSPAAIRRRQIVG